MSETSMIKPPRIGVAAEASAGHRMIGPARTDGVKLPPKPRAPIAADQQKRAGQFGAAPGVQINRRGEAPVTKLAPQTLQVLRSTLTSVRRYCVSVGGMQAAQLVQQTQALIEVIASGGTIYDEPAQPAQQPANVIAPPGAPTVIVAPPAPVTPPTSSTK